ncbi:virulence associated secretory protein [Salmonella enterica subsp. enterica]|nr:virulence associated secretory protein [Salmonella enterica subsp. enterica]
MLLSLLNSARLRPELLILVLMVMIISMFVIPLPTYLVDFLIALNIVLAILVFMGSFYIDRILSFSTFPAVLLITTLFRLALSISTSRLILIEADAGEIIATFGQFVIGDSLAVGLLSSLLSPWSSLSLLPKVQNASRKSRPDFLWMVCPVNR